MLNYKKSVHEKHLRIIHEIYKFCSEEFLYKHNALYIKETFGSSNSSFCERIWVASKIIKYFSLFKGILYYLRFKRLTIYDVEHVSCETKTGTDHQLHKPIL